MINGLLSFIRQRVHDENETLFSDDDILTICKKYSSTLYREPFCSSDGLTWIRYRPYPFHAFLSVPTCEDFSGNVITPDSIDPVNCRIIFDEPQTVVLVSVELTNVYAAISELWSVIASQKFELYSSMVGGTQEQLNQIYEHAVKQAEIYRMLAYPPRSGRMARIYD